MQLLDYRVEDDRVFLGYIEPSGQQIAECVDDGFLEFTSSVRQCWCCQRPLPQVWPTVRDLLLSGF